MNSQVDCKFFVEHLDAYLDSELDQEMRGRMIRHADQCPDCGERLESMTRLLTMCAELDEGLTVPLDVAAAWRRAVREEARAALHKAPRRNGRVVVRALSAVAAAAALLVGGTFAYRMGALPTDAPMPYGAQPSGAAYEIEEAFDEAQAPSAAAPSPQRKAAAGGSVMVASDGPVNDSYVAGEPNADAGERQKVVIRSAERGFESSAFDQTMQSIGELVSDFDGRIERSSVSGQPLEPGQSTGRRASLTVRVPVSVPGEEANLDKFLTSLDAVATLTYRSELADDISSIYYDVKSRLEFSRAQLKRLNELVTTAASLEEMLMLQDKVYEVQQEIDQMEGQMRGWDSYAADATVSIELSEVPARDQVQKIDGTLEKRVRDAFYASINWLSAFMQDAAVVLAMAVPALVVAIPIIIVVWVIAAAVRRRRRRRGK